MPSYEGLYIALAILLGTPAAIVFVLWRIFVTNRRSLAAAGVLGLNASSEESYSHTNLAQDLANFGLLSFVTISFVVFFFDAIWFVSELLELLETPIDYY